MTEPQAVVDSPRDWVRKHITRYVESGGEDGHEWKKGVFTLLLTTTGRRTGRQVRSALIYGRAGEDPDAGYVVVASRGGAPEHPAWYLNLAENPSVTVQVGPEVFEATASDATGDERAALWRVMAAIWPDYENYQKKTDREIPVVVLTPVT